MCRRFFAVFGTFCCFYVVVGNVCPIFSVSVFIPRGKVCKNQLLQAGRLHISLILRNFVRILYFVYE